jgi:hypothetical protein
VAEVGAAGARDLLGLVEGPKSACLALAVTLASGAVRDSVVAGNAMIMPDLQIAGLNLLKEILTLARRSTTFVTLNRSHAEFFDAGSAFHCPTVVYLVRLVAISSFIFEAAKFGTVDADRAVIKEIWVQFIAGIGILNYFWWFRFLFLLCSLVCF